MYIADANFTERNILFMIATKPLVSIVTITYNSENTIVNTVESILNQSYSNIEYIVIDGKSSDKTLSIIDSYSSEFKERDIQVTVLSEKDKGIADAWNKGLKLAKGAIIGLLNSDDWYDKNAVEIAVKTLDLDKNQISYGICKKIDSSGKIIHVMENTFSANRAYLNFGFSHTTCFVTKKTYDAVGNFNLDYSIAMDVDFLLRSAKSDVEFIKTDTVTFMRMGGVSTANKKRALQEYQQALVKNGYNRFLIGIFGLLKRTILLLKS